MDLKETVRQALRKRGVEVGGYRHTVRARRQQMLSSYGVDMVIDVGANVGQYALDLRSAGYIHRITSFEPMTRAYRQLERAAAHDPLWDARQVAVGDSAGVLTLNVSEYDVFSSPMPLAAAATASAPAARYVGTEEVPVETLDDLLEDVTWRFMALKIDVQGFERAVLDGAQKVIRDAKIVEMELSPAPVYEGQMLALEAMQRMEDAGFRLSLVENLFPDFATGRSLQFNGIFVRL